jgi:hypothetical protein
MRNDFTKPILSQKLSITTRRLGLQDYFWKATNNEASNRLIDGIDLAGLDHAVTTQGILAIVGTCISTMNTQKIQSNNIVIYFLIDFKSFK